METGLVAFEKINPVAVFTGGGLDPILKSISDQVMSFVPDTSTSKGRKEIAALAYKVAQSKTYLDGLGKDLVADWKEKAKLVDVARKTARDFLDDLKEKARKPLTDYEAEEARKEAEAKLLAEIEMAHEEAIAEHDLWLRQKAIESKEKEIAEAERIKAEADKKAAEEAEKAEREKRIAEEAAESARKAAAEAIESAKRAAIEAETRAKLAAEKAESDRKAAEDAARVAAVKAENDRIEAAKKAEDEKQKAVKAESERLERERKEAECVAAEKAKNVEHQRKINKSVLDSLKSFGLETGMAKALISLIATGKIEHVKIMY